MGHDASCVGVFTVAVLQESLHSRSQSGSLISREAEVAAIPSPPPPPAPRAPGEPCRLSPSPSMETG